VNDFVCALRSFCYLWCSR